MGFFPLLIITVWRIWCECSRRVQNLNALLTVEYYIGSDEWMNSDTDKWNSSIINYYLHLCFFYCLLKCLLWERYIGLFPVGVHCNICRWQMTIYSEKLSLWHWGSNKSAKRTFFSCSRLPHSLKLGQCPLSTLI